ncbi:MAG TPA: hypothetical protein PKV21_07995 [bacterium]|nr:hypothetical protein [bacterium]HOM27429.1 hypothetical protein [bacterium]
MENKIIKNRMDLEKYREKIFKFKEKCRKEFVNLPFEKKLKLSFQLAERLKYLKKFKIIKD